MKENEAVIRLEELQEGYEKIVVWGAGGKFESSFSGNLRIDYLVDSDIQKHGRTVSGLKIEPPWKLLSEEPKRTAVIICSNYWREITAEIKNTFDVYMDVMIQPNPFQKNLMYKSGFSLFAEDALIKGICDRYHIDILHYVDIGANHPYFGNASILFYLNGASGCLVEPNEAHAALLKKSRPNDIVINKGVSSRENDGKKLIYYKVKDVDTINTFSGAVAESHRKRGFQVKEEQVQVASLNSILEKYGKKVNYISIDVEGGEFEILNDFDFIKYDVEIFNVEKGDDRCKQLILNQGYEKAGETPSNWIFVKKGLIHEEV